MPDIFVANTNNQEAAPTQEEAVNSGSIPPTSPTAPTLSTNVIDTTDNGNGMVHLFTSYCEKPDDITFENQDDDENVLLFIRKDLITNLPWIITGFFLILIPLLIMPVLSLFHIPSFVFPQNYLFVLTVFYYLLIATFLFINFITWYFNLDIVTEKRILDISFEGIVYKNVAATKLTLVQDVSYTQIGVIRTIFDYGDVLIQTAGTVDNFIFDAVPRPEDAVHVVENLIGKRNEQP
jgi:hypothetical protein